MPASYRALIVSLLVPVVATGTATGAQFSVEVSGKQTPQLYAYDGVSVGMRRLNAGSGAPEVDASEPVQRFNAVVSAVCSQVNDPLTVNVTLLGAAPSLTVYVGDEVEIELLVVSSMGTPATGAPPPPPPNGSGTETGGGVPAPLPPASLSAQMDVDAWGHGHHGHDHLQRTW